MRSELGLVLRFGIVATAAGIALALAGGCSSNGSDGAGASGGSSSSSSGMGGAAPSERCKPACSIANKCAGVDILVCEKACANTDQGACAGVFEAWLGCVSLNQKTLESCAVGKDCDGPFHDFATCQQQQSPSDAASSGAGVGGGMGGCDVPTCGIGYGGITCDCTETCSGTAREMQCDNVLGGSVCGCLKGGVYLGSCFNASGCSLAGSCCLASF